MIDDPQAPVPPPPPPQRPGARRRRVRWLLIGSLGLNLLVAGVLAGAFLLRPDGAPGRTMRFDLSIFPYTAALAPEDRAALLRAWRAQGPGPRDIMADREAEARAVVALLRAEPFDAAALAALLSDRTARAAAHQSLGHALLLDRVAALDPAARAAYAARLEQLVARGLHRTRDGRLTGQEGDDRPRPPAPR